MWICTLPLRRPVPHKILLLFSLLHVALLVGRVSAKQLRHIDTSPSHGASPLPTIVVPINESHCPGGDTIVETKQNLVQIGILGCKKDPTLLSFPANSACWTRSVEHHSATPDYMIAILDYLEQVNRDPETLPYHRICVVPSLSASFEENLLLAYPEDIVVVIDALASHMFYHAHGVFLPLSMPTVRFSDVQRISAVPIDSIRRFIESDVQPLEQIHQHFDQQLLQDILFHMTPHPVMVYGAVQELCKTLKWKRVGLITVCDDPDSVYCRRLRNTYVVRSNGLQVFFSKYNPSNPLETFRLFIEEEIQIFTFHGNASAYLDVLLQASRYYFTGPK